jgi:hypothetical protein
MCNVSISCITVKQESRTETEFKDEVKGFAPKRSYHRGSLYNKSAGLLEKSRKRQDAKVAYGNQDVGRVPLVDRPRQ